MRRIRARAGANGGTLRVGVVVLALIAAACSSSTIGDVELTEPATESGTTASAAGDDAATAPVAIEVEVAADAPTPPPDIRIEPELIKVDQFGYRPADPKVAVIADPQFGYNGDVEFQPGSRIEVRRLADDEVVLTAGAEPWADGQTSEQSGDRGWWVDFSSVDEPGTYYVVDVDSGVGTGPFEISEAVYDDVLDAALRMFWFNRANVEHPAEIAGVWADGPAFVGPDQDTEARSVDDPDNPSTARDLSGGWFDAGDTSKYVTFAAEPVHLLLTAYQRHPELFDDAVGIPESGNGLPDLIDELRWEIDWLERMQVDDGGVLTKVGLIRFAAPWPPSSGDLPRYYEEVCSSATITAAAMFAHASIVFDEFDQLRDEAADLRTRAVGAWDWYQANPKRDDCDPQVVKAGDADLSLEAQDDAEVVAAIYLLAATDESRYADVITAGAADTLPFRSNGFGDYGPQQADALLYYRSSEGADPGVVAAIDERLSGLAATSPLFGFDADADLYRAFMPTTAYHWGSNRVKANVGATNLVVGDLVGDATEGAERAIGHLNYFHGVNPLGLVYLSNMRELGSERSAGALFHFWFGHGADLPVPPGYVVGGPNRQYSGSTTPPAGQPPQKSYRDGDFPEGEPAWEITEPAIYYQATYIRLLAAVMAHGTGGRGR
ncbi:MAG: glycoside hydrolase family 9 protein [Actinomycetota bacterium]